MRWAAIVYGWGLLNGLFVSSLISGAIRPSFGTGLILAMILCADAGALLLWFLGRVAERAEAKKDD